VPEGKQQAIVWDAMPGLGLRVRPSSASWVFTYRPKGGGRAVPMRTVTIGKWPAVTVDVARDAARKHAGAVALGGDPAAEVRAEKLRQRHRVSAALDEYERHILDRRLQRPKPIMSALRRGLAHLANADVDTLTRGQLVDAVERLERSNKAGAALYLRRHVRTFMERQLTLGRVPFNPMAGLRRPRMSRAEAVESAASGRALNRGEILAVWAAAGQLEVFGLLVRAALLTGMRRGELSGLRWADVRDDRIVLPAARMKAGREHQVPITPLLRQVLDAAPRLRGGLVFPSLRTGRQMQGWGQLVNRLRTVSEVDFTLHDLRRTFRTMLSDLDVAEAVAETAIAHARPDLVARYDKSQLWQARVEATRLVSDQVAQIVTPGIDPASANVVKIGVRT
jgi:integrase